MNHHPPSRLILYAVLSLALILPAGTPLYAAPEGHIAAINDMEMYYETTGEGPPLVLLHGFMRSGRAFDPFITEFSKQYRLIVPDLRGHGGSTNPSGRFTMRQSAQDIFALLDHLGIETFKPVGISAGAETLLHMATEQPDRVEAMILVGSGVYYPAACRESLGQIKPETYSEAGWALLRRTHRHGEEQIKMLFEQLAGFADSYDDVAFTPPQLSTITARTMLIQGDRDYCFPISMIADVYASIPDAYLWVIPRGGHVPIYDTWAPVFTETALEFLGGAWSGK
jgi:pimeloyl-ACP methyl ester carboxylesterase